ncbi:hypothetical protein CAPTEDRAFT_217853 [Capitella teleta]|uniref:F-box domain-containing protein n=1 Tax=Capitella teleta TaxID=283909 RepID=R7VFV5_CAPTE|nr:hypothetical protein CAPTEDRAFT_217853 [Capitella teleta]|eukprot:ELU17713.1 hypothetical protein CAPTEDRAFT_217853 [Capitella teleta]
MDENEKQKPKVHYVHVKKRRIHLDSSACEALSQSEEGSRALTQPQSIPHSSRDPNRGLYPRPSGGFRSASQVMNSQGHASALAGCANKEGNGFQTASQVMQSQGRLTDFVERKPNAGSSMKRNTRAKLLSPQSNTLNNYFKPVQKSPIKIYGSPVKKVPGSSLLYTMEPSQPQKLQPPAAKQKPKKKLKYDKAKALSQSQHEWLHEREKSEDESAKTFGLLGDAADAELIDLVAESDEEEDYFASVPDEILENILCQLPLQDLCLNANRVCLRWSSIISGAKFIPWKKRYHKYLKDHEVMADVTGLAEENEMTDQMTCFLSLFRFMKSFKLVTAPDMLAAMRKHPKWSWAEDFAKEKTKLFKEDLSCHPWAMLTLLVFVSECVDDVLEVIRCLVGSHSQCLIHEVLESLYCVALFLLHFKKTFVNCYYNVLHYRVYYALYLYENESAITCGELSHQVKGQQTIDRYAEHSISVRLTHEQLRICNHDIQEGDTIKIIAFAGTGKTTTLIKYTQLRPGLKFLLIVYNKAINEHSKQCFPLNVTCRTAHSLAYQKIGRRYAAVKKLYNLKIMDIVDRLTARQGISLYVQAKFVRDAIMAFLASADRVIDMDHVPSFICEEDQVKHELNAYQRLAIVDDANSMWKRMIDLQDKAPLTHDGYLKMYQLQKPVNDFDAYDVILIDEAQDLTPAVADILLSLNKPKILVGDPHQQIYAFRGAVDSMQLVTATRIFYLTQSWPNHEKGRIAEAKASDVYYSPEPKPNYSQLL